MKKGGVTVFLSLMLAVLLFFFQACLQSARVAFLRSQTQEALELAEYSILSEYHRELFERYGLIYVELGYGGGLEDTGYLEQRLREFLKVNVPKGAVMAVEAWERAKDMWNDGMFSEIQEEAGTEDGEEEQKLQTLAEALEEFQEYVKKRIKEGPPKIQIGGSEFSQVEWEKLIRKMDKAIDIYKTELRKKIQELKEKAAKQIGAGSATENQSLKETAEGDSESEKTKGPEVSETEAIEDTKESEVSEAEAIEGTVEYAQRGTGFLARISGVQKAPYSYLADETGTIVYKGVHFTCDDKKQQICLGDMSNPNRVLNIPLSKGGVLRVNQDNLGDLVKAIDMFSPEDIARILKAIAKFKKVENMELEIEDMKSKGPAGAAQGASE